MSKRKLVSFFKKTSLVLIVFISVLSCKKEGCMVYYADNYDAEAKKSNNSCQYSIALSVWWDMETSQKMQKDGITALSFYFDGKFITTRAASQYWYYKPTNGSDVIYSKKIGNSIMDEIIIEVYDQKGNKLWYGSRLVTAEESPFVLELNYE